MILPYLAGGLGSYAGATGLWLIRSAQRIRERTDADVARMERLMRLPPKLFTGKPLTENEAREFAGAMADQPVGIELTDRLVELWIRGSLFGGLSRARWVNVKRDIRENPKP